MQRRGNVKKILSDYQGALKDLDKADFFQPHDALTLQSHGDVKSMLKDYEPTLQDLDKAIFLKPNNKFILRLVEMSKDVERLSRSFGKP